MPVSHVDQPLTLAAPVGLAAVVVGGIVAQASHMAGEIQVQGPPSVGTAGLILSLSGLLGAGFQYYKEYLNAKQRDAKIAEQASRIADLESKIVEASEKRHKLRNQFNAVLMQMQDRNDEYQYKIANLEGRLGITATVQGAAINAVAGTVKEIAEHRLYPPMPVDVPHLDELANSGELAVYIPRKIVPPLSESDVDDPEHPQPH